MMMENTAFLKWVELAPSELIVEVAHYELLEVPLHKLIEVAHFELILHNQHKRILVSCVQETVGAFWHSFFLLTVKMTFS